VAVGDIRTKIRDILGAFMFGGEASDKKVKVLSGGERSRLAMIRLLLEPVNLLILDEPTNHLDMRSKDVLKEAIKAFDGTAIIVSHDRDFLDGLATKVYEFGNKKVREHLGGIYEFLQHKRIESLDELGFNAQKNAAKNKEKETQNTENKLNYEARKEHTKRVRKAQKAVEDTEKEIATLEAEIANFNQLLTLTENAANPDFVQKYQKSQRLLEQKLYEWEIQSAAVEEIQKELGE
jgi:ATP-binding cassette subfamily F protein 3